MSASVLWVFQRPGESDGVKSSLEQEGFDVQLTGENLAALETFQRTKPDVVVIEVAFPDTEKLELCSVLKATPQGHGTPVLVVTGADNGMSFRAQAIHQYDADEFVYPFEPPRIAAACTRWLRRAEEKSKPNPAPHQAALEEALDRLDTLLAEDVMAPVENIDSPGVAQPAGQASQSSKPLRESIDELSQMSDDLVDRLPLQAREDAVEQTPPPGKPKDTAQLHRTLEQLEMMDDDDLLSTSAEVEVGGDRGDDIQAQLDTMFERSERHADAPARPHVDDEDVVDLTELDETDGDELVTIESEDADDSVNLDIDTEAPQPIPEPVSAAEPELSIVGEIETEVDRHDEDEALVETDADPDMHEVQSPAAIDPSLPHMEVPHEEPRRGLSMKWWAAAAVVAIAAGAGVLWMLTSGGDAAEPTTVAETHRGGTPARPYEPAPGEPTTNDVDPTIATPGGTLEEPTPVEIEKPEAEAEAAVASVEKTAEPVTPPPSPFRASREATPRKAVTPRAELAPSGVDDARTRPGVIRNQPTSESETAGTTRVALGPKPTERPPRRDATRVSDGPAVEAAPDKPVESPTTERPERVVPSSVAASEGREGPEPRRKEVREAPPFAGTEKTGAGPNVGRPSDALVAVAGVEPSAPPPSEPLVTRVTPPPGSDAQVIPTSVTTPEPVPEAKPKEPEVQVPAYEPPRIVSRAEPSYPPKARKAGVGGTVVLEVLVSESGAPVRVVVKDGAGNSDLEAAAIHAVLRSSFDPAREGGATVRGWTTEKYVFEP